MYIFYHNFFFFLRLFYHNFTCIYPLKCILSIVNKNSEKSNSLIRKKKITKLRKEV